MNNSGDAAEQVVRLSLEGTEIALKLTGTAAAHIAAAIYVVLKNRDKNKIKGRQRLTAMLKSGKELKVFTVGEEHLKQFAKEAKRYGVVYCALRGRGKSEDGLVDIMVRAEDAAKINRIVERFKMATVDTASIKAEIEHTKAEKAATQDGQSAPEQTMAPAEADRLLDDLLAKPVQKKERASENPAAARTEKSPPSEPISGKPSKAAEGTANPPAKRPSVREALREIMKNRKQAAEQSQHSEPDKGRSNGKRSSSKQPANKQSTSKKPKPKKAKER